MVNLVKKHNIVYNEDGENMIYKLTKLPKNNKYLKAALTHSSYAHENKAVDYERIEFLGDAVIELIISEYLFKTTNLSEGDMTLKRANFVCEKALYEYSKDLNLKNHIKAGKGVLEEGINEAIISDVFEAVVGAVYVNNGYNAARKFVLKLTRKHLENNTNFLLNYKSLFQETMLTNKQVIDYRTVDEYGEPHKKTFIVELFVNDISYGKGKGSSKKEAEQEAAKDALSKNAGVKNETNKN